MNYTLLLCAMDEELEVLKKNLSLIDMPVPQNVPWNLFHSEEHSIIAAVTGIGKVNAAACCSYLLGRYDIDDVIGIGVAGGIAPDLKLGDIIVCNEAMQHDIDVSAFGYQIGEIPRLKMSIFSADKSLTEAAISSADALNLVANTRTGRVLTGDCFVAGELGGQLYNNLGGDCVDMESAAWAHVCYLYQKPWIIIRSISDQANGEAPSDFSSFLRQAVSHMSELVTSIVHS